MAVLERMPSQAQIRKLAGILDFYYFRGVACVRTWPCKPRQTPGMVRTNNNLRQGMLLWNTVLEQDYQAYTYAVESSELINRDMFLGNVLRMSTPRSLVTVNSVHLIGLYIYVNIDLIQGDKPLLSVNWLDDTESTRYITWLKSSKRTRGYPFGKKDIPKFHTGYWKTISWLNGHGFFIFRNRERVLFFHFVDPYEETNYCSGVYHYDYRI